ncbi:MAG: cysteine desulfurase [Bacteroidetes bacterium]|nr:MAG: cysteine desulfurase [Bacteroidota bacterium]
MQKPVYLDNAATTQIDIRVVEVMSNLMSKEYGNPSSIHGFGRSMKVKIEEVRSLIANRLNVQPAEIFFTSGGTEAINTIFNGAVHSLNVKRIITTKIEHPAVLASAEYHSKTNDTQLDFVNIDDYGTVDLEHLKELLTGSSLKTLVSLMHANNELGTLLSLEKVSEVCHANNALLFSDTVQTMGKYPNDLSNQLLDFALSSAHKYHGPKGIGFMFVNGNLKIEPFIVGGGQERNMRAGTENVIGIVGMGKAFELAYEEMEENRTYMLGLKSYLVDKLKKELPHIVYNGGHDGLHSILNIGVPYNKHNEMILMNMDIAGIAVSGGSACSSGALHLSHVIEALGKAKKISPIRVSFSKYTIQSELDIFVEVLKKKLSFVLV